jgi:predicted AlkP superfamily pyrophosphatase or phosphodiesterase
VKLVALLCAIATVACPASQTASAQQKNRDSSIVVLVALDGFRPSYLDRPSSTHLSRLAREGVRARWMEPEFPTLTFPNFYSIATGLYPANHGIVSNTIDDSVLGRFTLRDTAIVHDPRWWGGEPIWVTAVRRGKRAATFFWPGSDVAIGGVRPTYYKVFDPKVPNDARVRQVLDWLSLPSDRAPQLITLYMGDVDEAGHQFGPDTPETDSAIARVDSAVGAIMAEVKQRGLDTRVNLVIVSDHGMAPIASNHWIYLDDLLDSAAVRVGEVGAVATLSPRTGTGEDIYRPLKRARHLKVFRKNELPAAYHYRDNARIPPILVIADEGWAVTTRGYVAARGGRLLRGIHGYPPEIPSMRAIFLAQGPAFKKGVVVPPFQNIQVYNLVAGILGLRPGPNDGKADWGKAVRR